MITIENNKFEQDYDRQKANMTFKLNNLNSKANLSVGHPRIAIIGGGVAGMSCALWLKQLNLSPEIIECNATLGGQLLEVDRINRWVLGFQNLSSQELAKLYRNHIYAENILVSYNSKPVAIEKTESDFRVFLQKTDDSQSESLFQAIVIATGVRVLGPEIFNKIPGFDSLFTAGLIGCFPTDHLKQLESLRGKTVAIVGGGDNAHFTVCDVASIAAQTFLLMRSQPKAQKSIRNEVNSLINQGRVIEHTALQIMAFSQSEKGIELSFSSSNSVVSKITVDKVFIRTGYTANSEFLLTLDNLANIKKLSNGYIETDSGRRTSIASVYAIGDVASPKLQSVVTAIADGAIAARTIAEDFEKKEVFQC